MIDRSQVYETLKNQLGENETKVLLQYMDGIVTTKVAGKEDVARLDGRFDRLEDAFDIWLIFLQGVNGLIRGERC